MATKPNSRLFHSRRSPNDKVLISHRRDDGFFSRFKAAKEPQENKKVQREELEEATCGCFGR